MRLAISIGNTHTKIAYLNDEDWFVEQLDTKDLSIANLSEQRPEKIGLCSVVPDATTAVLSWCAEAGIQFNQLKTAADAGYESLYEPIHSMGADRIANLLGARKYTTASVLVIDFGTATTLTAMSDANVILGGVILPSPYLQAESLNRMTAQLPVVDPKMVEPVLGRSTEESIQIGTVTGHFMAVQALAEEIQDEHSFQLFLTGRWANEYQAKFCPEGTLVTDLGMEGLIEFTKKR